MSRIGKKKITILPGVSASMEKNELVIKGPKGELKQTLHPHITVEIDEQNKTISVYVRDENYKQDRALWGTFSSLISNMINGVTAGFKKQLEISGVGYKVNMKGENLSLEVGFSHPVEIKPPAGIKFSVEKNLITVEGADKQSVGEMAARIRKVRKPEPYKGKGIKYAGEVIRRKAGKTAGKEAAA